MSVELSVIIVSYNTREMTLKAIETLYANSGGIHLQVILWDNASNDGSAEAVSAAFPEVEVHASPDNLGFAGGNNRAAEHATGEWVLLLNSDTEVLPGAISNLIQFAKANPTAGIVGGRTIFADGSLNATSCFNRMTVWSLMCTAFGLASLFRGAEIFDPERIEGDKMDAVREVDIVTGCFFLLRAKLWQQLDGFDRRYFMYAEETDLCLRAHKLGYKPMVTPEATIIHHGGASAISSARKQLQSLTGRATLVRDHFDGLRRPAALGLLWFMVLNRYAVHTALGWFGKLRPDKHEMWKSVWDKRRQWLAGY